MTKLYIFFKILTFPGAYLRGFWEQLTCKLLGLPVETPGYLRIDEACGHVEHALAKKSGAAYLIATGPGFMNLMTGFPIFLMGFVNLAYMGVSFSDSPALFIFYVLMTYLGISLLCSLFPLVEDAMNLADAVFSKGRSSVIGKILMFIPSIITYVGAYLEKFCIPLIFWVVMLVMTFAF